MNRLFHNITLLALITIVFPLEGCSQNMSDEIPSAEDLYSYGIYAHSKGMRSDAEKCRKMLFDISFTYETYYQFAYALEYAEYGYKLSLIKDKKNSWEYCESLRCISSIYSHIPDSLSRAIELAERSVDLCKRLKGKQSKDYALYLCALANYHKAEGDYEKAAQYLLESIGILENINPYDDDFFNVLGELVLFYDDIKDYPNALIYAKKLVENSKNNAEQYGLALFQLAGIYIDIGDNNKAVETLTESLLIYENNNIFDDGYYSTLGLLMALLKDKDDATYMRLFYKQVDFVGRYKETSKFDKVVYVSMLSDMARTLKNYGDAENALGILTEADSIASELHYFSKRAIMEIRLLLASCLSDLGYYDDALLIYDWALGNLMAETDIDSSLVAGILSDAASCHNGVKKFELAIQLERASLSINKRDPFCFPAANNLGNLAAYYINSEKYDSAMLSSECSLIILDSIDSSHFYYPSTYSYNLYLQTECLLHNHMYDSAYAKLEQSYLIWFENIIQSLNVLANIQREKLLQHVFYRINTPFTYQIRNPYSKDLTRLCYNLLLFKKGLLLNYQKSSTSGYGIDNDKNSNPIIQKHHIPTYLSEASSEYNSMQKLNMDSISHHRKYLADTIARMISNNDVLIEFGKCYDNEIRYIALILRKDWSAPKSVILGSEMQLEEMAYSQMQQVVWQAIIDSAQIKEGENIYFAPDGIFYNIPIEYLPLADGRNMSDVYNMFRVSSTRELCFRDSTRQVYSSAVLYGGLKYDAMPQKGLYALNRSDYRGIDNMSETVWTQWRAEDRAKYNYLPYTLKEVDSISNTINGSLHVTTYTDEYGDEKSFKALSGNSPSILHVATHGYYITPTQAEVMSRERLAQYGVSPTDERQSVIDYSMERTGLLLAGAQYTLRGDTLPQDADDGILSAKEISHLDLTNTDLVVLSACQTALGDITNDGVAGLQRGFKIAGVKSILMSLWQVDDAATYLLMKRFYQGLVSGKSKQQALREAQQYLRSYTTHGDYPYSDIRYWGAFVLLDAIE